MQLSPF